MASKVVWRREKPGCYWCKINGMRYDVMRYYRDGQVGRHARWLVYGVPGPFGYVEAFFDLKSAQSFVERRVMGPLVAV